jgi:hypothetical protein
MNKNRGKHISNWDRPYKIIFSNPDIVKDLIINYYNADWAADIDFSTLEKLPTEFVGEELDETRDDVIWQVNFKNTKLYIVFLIEFQSKSEKYMAARMLSYIGNLYLDLIRTKKVKGRTRLPPILPIVVYNGKAPWKAVQSFRKLVNCPYKSLEKYIPDAFYEVFEEREIFKQITHPQNLVDLLVSIEFSRDPETMKNLFRQLCGLADSSERFNNLLRGFMLLIRRGLLRSSKSSANLPDFNWEDAGSPQEVNHMLEITMQSWANKYLAQGINKGREEGIEKGKVEIALKMIAKDKSFEEISEITELPIDQIKKLAENNKVSEPSGEYKTNRKTTKKKK